METTLSQLEGKFVRVQEKIKEEKTLDKWEKAYLAAFMATMHSRTDPFAEGMEQIWTQVDDVVKQMEDVLKKSDRAKLPPPMFPGEGSPISSTDTQYMIRNARAIAVESALQTAGTMEEQIEQQSRIGRIILRSRRTKALAIVDEHRGVHRKQHQVLILEKHEQKRSTRLLERDGNGTSAELSVHTAKPSQTSCDQPR